MYSWRKRPLTRGGVYVCEKATGAHIELDTILAAVRRL